MFFDDEDGGLYGDAVLFAFGPADRLWCHFNGRQRPAFFEALPWDLDSHHPAELTLWHGRKARLAAIGDRATGWRGMVWGRLFDTADGACQTAFNHLLTFARSGETACLRRLGGFFVAIVFHAQKGILHIVNDCLGVRPFFIYENGSLLFGASHAFLLSDHVEGAKRAHMGAVSQYLLYGYNATRSSLLEGVLRLPPSSITRWRDGRCDYRSYGPSAGFQPAIGHAAMAERVHAVVSRSYDHWTRGQESLVIGLSGGFDSRYLAVLASRNAAAKHRFVNVASEPGEYINARATASRLGLDLEVVAVDGSIWDAYAPEDVFHSRPDGFPVTKSVNRLVARRAPGASMVDGYLGDALIRGHFDHIVSQADGSRACALEAILAKMQVATLSRLMPRHYRAIAARALEEARAMRGSVSNDVREITFVDLYMRQRFCISNNFVQNMHDIEVILPFLTPELIDLKIYCPIDDFGQETYASLFLNHFPELAAIGHSADSVHPPRPARISRVHQRWALQILGRTMRRRAPPILDRSFLVPRLLLALARPEQAYIVRIAMFVALLDSLCEARDIAIDWSFDNEVAPT